MDRFGRRHRFHRPILLTAPVVFAAMTVATNWNPIYTSSAALLVGGILTLYCRPDLARSMFTTGISFAVFYFLFFLSLTLAHPGYVDRVWNLDAISGVLILGVPIEELLFAFSLGFLWSSAYEHATWQAHDHGTS